MYMDVALACTGLRISELASLRWSDIDPGLEKIHLTDESQQSHKRGKGGRETKSGRDRSLPVYPDLAAVLKRIKREPDGLIFHGPLGGRLKPDLVRTALIRDVLEPLKESFTENAETASFVDGRLHSFRHYFCSTCASSGVPEQVVMNWLGHSDSKMVKHYFHLFDADSQRHMMRLDFLGRKAGSVAGPGG